MKENQILSNKISQEQQLKNMDLMEKFKRSLIRGKRVIMFQKKNKLIIYMITNQTHGIPVVKDKE